MASQLPTSTSLLTSPTNFQGIPISQLLAALYGDTTTPSTQYAQPVMHSSSASFRKGIDPRNRPKAGGESEAARGSRLIRERRARQAARAEAEKTKAEAAKNTGTIMRTISGMTGGTVGTKPAPAREGGFPPLADQVSNRRDLLIPQGPVGDRSYDAAEAARLGARTMGPPSSVYRAPEATPVSRTFDDPTLRPEVAAAYARIGTPEQNAARRAADLAANREREAANAARREAEAAEMAALNQDVARAQGAVSGSEARLNALRQAERDQELDLIRRLPVGMTGNLSLADVERAVLNSPQVLGRVAADGAAGVGELLRNVGGIFMPSAFGQPNIGGYGAPAPEPIPADRRYDAAESARLAPRTMQPTAPKQITTEPTTYSTVRPISSILNPSGIPEMLARFNPNAVPQPKTFESSAYRTLPSAGSIGADPNTYADRRYDAVEAARGAPRTPEPSFMDWLRSQLPASFSDPRSMYYFPGTYY